MAPMRRSRAKEDVHETGVSSDAAESEASGKPKLKFGKPISWPAGRPIAEGELVKRLEAFQKELHDLDENMDLESLKPKAKDLCADRLLRHRNKGVHAWTGLCIVEVLRIFAPDAPYTGKELKDIFTMMIEHIVPHIADSGSPYHAQHRETLASLQEMQSILLILDIPCTSHLLKALFTVAFDVLSGPSRCSKSAKYAGKEITRTNAHMLTSLLSMIVAESSTIPDEVVDIILAQFLRADPGSMASHNNQGKAGASLAASDQPTLYRDAPAAYTMAQEICAANDVRMARYVLRYFSSVLLDTTMLADNISRKPQKRKHDYDDQELLKGPSEEELRETQKAHKLLRELWRAAPSVLQEIVPQLETELSTDSTPLRLIAVETIGDMIAGIGAAGPPNPPTLDPTAYPSQSVQPPKASKSYDFLKTPSAVVPLTARFQPTYHAFLARRNDKSPLIRAAWTTAVGRIISTFAGGVGLEPDEEITLLKYFSESLVDGDEKVRHAAIQAIHHCSLQTVVNRLGRLGGVNDHGSILAHLADRAKDKKLSVRTDAIRLLADLWGVSAAAILAGDELVTKVVGGIPSKLINTYYVNDPDIHKSLDRALFDSLIPLNYPPSKVTIPGDTTTRSSTDDRHSRDHLRVERILLLIKSLDSKAKAAFWSKQKQQPQLARYWLAFLQQCELFNGGVIDPPPGKTEQDVTNMLNTLITHLASFLPDRQKAAEDLKKFAKQHDRRSYILMRNCLSVDSDWSKIRKSIKEMSRRIIDSTSSSSLPSSMLDTLLTLLYRASLLVFNRSNVPAVINFSKSSDNALGAAAHDMLKELSRTQGEVFSTHVQDLCRTLTADAPTSSKPQCSNAVDDLKACADFARQFPEKIPQDTKFSTGLMAYVKHGQPLAAKYAVRILLTTSDQKHTFTKQIFAFCTSGFQYGAAGFLSRLAALTQVVLYGYLALDVVDLDLVHKIAINDVLINESASTVLESDSDDVLWTDEPDDHISGKLWAMKTLVNLLRAAPDEQDIKDQAEPVFKLLERIVTKSGQISTKAPAPQSYASRIRLFAVLSLLKLARERRFNEMITPGLFNVIALTAQDAAYQVRDAFVTKTIKFLGQRRLPNRFYTPLFLLAFEPDTGLKKSTETWLRARVSNFARDKDMVMELIIARLISLIAYHPDYCADTESLISSSPIFIFYLCAIANEDNISTIYYLAQRVKNIRDGIRDKSANIYVLSDLVQAIIRLWEERNNWSMQALSIKVNLPSGIFKPMTTQGEGLAIANKNFLPEDALVSLDEAVTSALKRPKRAKRIKMENGTAALGVTGKNDGVNGKKRVRSADALHGTFVKRKIKKQNLAETPKRQKIGNFLPSSERRRSGRHIAAKNYHESSDEGDDMDDAADNVNDSNDHVHELDDKLDMLHSVESDEEDED